MRMGGSEASKEEENMIYGDDKKSNEIQILLLCILLAMLTFPPKKISYYISPDYLNDREFKYF